MNTKLVLASFIAALSGFTGLATTAKAGADLHVNLNLGLPRPPVIVVPGRGHDSPVYGYDRGYDQGPRGYWKEIVVKTWVPARWVVSRDRRGYDHRVLESGYYAYRTDRVWIRDGGNFDRYDGRDRR